MILPQIPRPSKPREGEACNGCGACCAAEVCRIGLEVLGEDATAPCELLSFHDGRFWCSVVEVADKTSVGPLLRMRLGIGIACDSSDSESEVA